MKIIDLRKKKEDSFFEKLIKRGELEFEEYFDNVNSIIQYVKEKKDEALIELTKKFDNFELNEKNYFFGKDDFLKAYNSIDENLKDALTFAAERIENFHKKQKKNSWITTGEEGIILGQKITPIERAGMYVPGGKALYPSTLLMTVIPAKVAGVKEIYVTSPIFDFEKVKSILAAAYIAKVDKIVGPGNIYVAMAKKILFGLIDIDMFAGPSEILIIADESANPDFIANDLLSQAEHDELASAILVTVNEKLAENVKLLMEKYVKKSKRKEILEKSINNYSVIIIVSNLDECVEIANKIAPEHLEIMIKKPFSILNKIKNAGAIFLGEYSPEPIGDYVAGTNHVLPTGGTSRFFSPLSVEDFYKKSSIVYISKDAYRILSKHAKILADEEGLIHHVKSLEVRDDS